MARKTAYVSEMILRTLNQHHQTVPSAVHKATTLDDEVGGGILNRKIPDSQGTNYTYRKPITSSYANHTFVHVQQRINFGNCSYKYKTRAENMLRFFRQSGKINWKDDGRVSYQDREITDSNIADLINDQMRSRKTFNPRGWLPFTEALKEINVPNYLIGNLRRLNITTGSKWKTCITVHRIPEVLEVLKD